MTRAGVASKRDVPKFGDRVENLSASDRNPTRHGLFVRVVTRTGRVMNPGTWWELTDGKGEFWQVSPDNCVVNGGNCA